MKKRDGMSVDTPGTVQPVRERRTAEQRRREYDNIRFRTTRVRSRESEERRDQRWRVDNFKT